MTGCPGGVADAERGRLLGLGRRRGDGCWGRKGRRGNVGGGMHGMEGMLALDLAFWR